MTPIVEEVPVLEDVLPLTKITDYIIFKKKTKELMTFSIEYTHLNMLFLLLKMIINKIAKSSLSMIMKQFNNLNAPC
jgi:hypothetical protein